MHRSGLLLALAVLASGFLCNLVRADSFSFSVGSGGRGHHHHHGHHHGYHHHHCHGPYWGISLWSPPPPRYIYVAPPIVQERVYVQPPVVQERVIIQQAQQPQQQPMVLRNTSGNGMSVAYLIDNRNEELHDGQSRTMTAGPHVVEFDRGGGLGTARYEISAGLYNFVVSSRGWDLVRDTGAVRTADRPAVKRNELPGDIKTR